MPNLKVPPMAASLDITHNLTLEGADPFLVVVSQEDPSEVTATRSDHVTEGDSFGCLGFCASVSGPEIFAPRMLVLPIGQGPRGIDVSSAKVFWYPASGDRPQLVPRSGFNVGGGFAWAKIDAPGSYVAIGLPVDRVLRESILGLAIERVLKPEASNRTLLTTAFAPFLSLHRGHLQRAQTCPHTVRGGSKATLASPRAFHPGGANRHVSTSLWHVPGRGGGTASPPRRTRWTVARRGPVHPTFSPLSAGCMVAPQPAALDEQGVLDSQGLVDVPGQ